MPISNLLQNGCCCGGDTYGGTTGDIPSCLCDPSPTWLQMTSSDESANFGMFRDCTIEWGPIPADLAGSTSSDPGYYSTGTFTDGASGSDFYYYLTCSFNQWNLTRIFPTSPFGSPFRDAVLYTWEAQSCSPFLLIDTCAGCGPFPGSDPVSVSIATF